MEKIRKNQEILISCLAMLGLNALIVFGLARIIREIGQRIGP